MANEEINRILKEELERLERMIEVDSNRLETNRKRAEIIKKEIGE